MMLVRTLEEASITAWPSLAQAQYDGWLLRFADGYTRRANSVNPLYPSHLPLDEKIAYCEALYHAKGLKSVFKLTSAVHPPELDAALDAAGYTAEAPTSVQTVALDFAPPEYDSLRIATEPDAAWLRVYFGLNAAHGSDNSIHYATARQMLSCIPVPVAFAGLHDGAACVAVGLAVITAGYAGLFDIVVAPEYQRQGLGRRLVTGLMGWAMEQGAHTAYLQVMLDNAPAINLYAGLGFGEVYRYWYRVK